jgi:menaquinone-dependent protoporphyrinogen oxidase
MDKKVLIAYGSWAGSTAEVAESVAHTLQEAGLDAIACPARTVSDLSPYRAVVLGSAVRMGKLHKSIPSFISRHKTVLSQMPVACFLVCLTMKEDTEENRCTAENYLKPLLNKYGILPVTQGLFAGVMDLKKLAFPFGNIMKAAKLEEEDYRDPDAIRSWALSLVTKF